MQRAVVLRDEYLKSFYALYSKESFAALAVIGPAGVGKTTLINTFLNGIQSRAEFINLSCHYNHHVADFFFKSLICEVIRSFDIDSESDVDSVRRHLKYFLFLEAGEIEEILALISGRHVSVDPNKLSSIAIRLISDLNNPVVFIEDVHWANDHAIYFIKQLVQSRPENTMLFLSSRIEELPYENIEKIFIETLSRSESEELINSQLGYRLKQNQVDEIFSLTKGNAYYLNALTMVLKEKTRNNPVFIQDMLNIPMLDDVLLHSVKDKTALKILSIISCMNAGASIELIAYLLRISSAKIQKYMSELTRAGLIQTSQQNFFIFHDVAKRAIYNSIDRKPDFHAQICDALIAIEARRPVKSIEEISYHAMQANKWAVAYKYSSLARKKALRQFSPEIALVHCNRCLKAAQKIGRLTDHRNLSLMIEKTKILFSLGSAEMTWPSIKSIIYLLKNKEQLPASLLNEAYNVLSLYYWNSGELRNAVKYLNEVLLSKNINEADVAIFKFRLSGVLSDMGRFKESNKIILDHFNSRKKKASLKIFGIYYSIDAAMHSVLTRNYAYLGEKEIFLQSAKDLTRQLDRDNSWTEIFCLTFVADGYLAAGYNDQAYEFATQAVQMAKLNGLTALNSFLFSIIGYLESSRGNASSLLKIHQAISAAEKEQRFGRLPLYYLYMLKARKRLRLAQSEKRLAKKALTLAIRNGEAWVEAELKALIARGLAGHA